MVNSCSHQNVQVKVLAEGVQADKGSSIIQAETNFRSSGIGNLLDLKDWNISKEIALDKSAWRLAINVPEL